MLAINVSPCFANLGSCHWQNDFALGSHSLEPNQAPLGRFSASAFLCTQKNTTHGGIFCFYLSGAEASCSLALNGSTHFGFCAAMHSQNLLRPLLVRVIRTLCSNSSLSNKKIILSRGLFFYLGRKDSNLRDGWTKTSCLTTWRRPNMYQLHLQFYIIKFHCQYYLKILDIPLPVFLPI